MELRELLKKYPEEDLPFRKIAEKALGDEATGCNIRNTSVHVSASMHLLYQNNYRQQMSFTHFLERFGI